MDGLPEIRARSFEGVSDSMGPIANLLTRAEQEQIRRIASIIEFAAADIVYSEGDAAQFVHFVESGVIRISRCAQNGQRQILAFRVPGDVFGLPDTGRYVNSAEAVAAARVYRLPWQRMYQLMRDDAQLQLSLLTKIIGDFRQAQARIMTLGQQNNCQRLASFLLDFARVPEFFDEKHAVLKLPVNRFDLADYLGTAPESAARAFAKLESMGLIRRITSRTIAILDLPGLKSLQRGPRRSHQVGTAQDKRPAAETLPVLQALGQ